MDAEKRARELALECVKITAILLPLLQRTETLLRENKALRLAICPDGSLTDLDDLIDHAAELNLAESDMRKLLNPEQRMLEENKALRGLLIELMDNMVCDGEGQCHGLGKDKIKEDIETRIAAALGDA